MRRAVLCVLALLPAAAAALHAEGSPCTASAKASKVEVMAGEVFTVEVDAQGPAGAQFTFPREAGDEQVELWSGRALARSGQWRYEAMALAVGEAQVPPVQVSCRLLDGSRLEAKTAPVALRLISVLPKDAREQKLADVRPPVAVAVGAPFWIALGLLLCVLGGLMAWLWRRRRKPAAPHPVPEVSPSEEARAALGRLSGAGLLAGRDFRAFYICLIEIVKRYLERRLQAPVLDMTTTETVAFLRQHPQAESVAVTTRELLAAGDQIKFARGDGLSVEAERHLRAVGTMVDALEAKLAPVGKEVEG